MALKNGEFLNSIEIEIENISPLNIGRGDGEPLIDEENNKVYILGTTLAGAIRNFLDINEFKHMDKLFGGGIEGFQSKLYVYDSYSNLLSKEVRPGVSIDRFSGAANNRGKFERIYVGEGHKFIINLEIYADNIEEFKEFNRGIYSSIAAINNGNITLGSYKTSGAGIFKVNSIREVKYDFNNKEDLFMYLLGSKEYKEKSIEQIELENIYNNSFVEYELDGELRTPLLVKGISTLDYNRADDEQFRNTNGDCIIPGTSLKGVIRSQGERILKLYEKEGQISKIFGASNNEELKRASRFTAFDSEIQKSIKSTYNKIKVDRFTGGVITGQKMEDEPITGQVNIKGKLKLNKSAKKDEAVGLIALVFRDIAMGELPIGSGNNVGRGRIKGNNLRISLGNEVLFKWDILNDKVEINKIDEFIDALSNKEAE